MSLSNTSLVSSSVSPSEFPASVTPTADCTLFNFIHWGILGSISCLLGAVGNALSFIAFQRDQRRAPTTLLQCLATSDFILLVTVFATDPLPYICDYTQTCTNLWRSWPYIRYVWLITPVSHMCSIWFVVLIALNRYWAVCRPHAMHAIWTMRHTVSYIIGVLVFIIGFNSPRFFEYTFYEVEISLGNSTMNSTGEPESIIVYRENRTAIGNNHYYKAVYKALLVNIILILIPLIVLIVLTLQILSVIRSKRRRGSQRLRQSHQQHSQQNQNNNGTTRPEVRSEEQDTALEPLKPPEQQTPEQAEQSDRQQLLTRESTITSQLTELQNNNHQPTTPPPQELQLQQNKNFLSPVHPQHKRLSAQSSHTGSYNSNTSSRRSQRPITSASARSEITFVLVLVVTVAIVCNMPLCVSLFVRVNQDDSCGTYTFYLDNIGKLLVNVMSCINFVIYCLFSTKFRSILKATLCCQPVTRQLLGPAPSVARPSSFRIGRNWSFTISTTRRK